ncbi:MAG: YbjQ family protein [Actinomycetota bacterium]|nr:YbjQ family protein [Actinomycetota bacterium]
MISRSALCDLGSDLTSVFRGNLEGIEKAIHMCTEQVRERMYLEAERVGADAIVGLSVRLESAADKAQAVLMAGTAVLSRPIDD